MVLIGFSIFLNQKDQKGNKKILCSEKKISSQSDLFQHNKIMSPKVIKTEYLTDALKAKICLKFHLIVDVQQSLGVIIQIFISLNKYFT